MTAWTFLASAMLFVGLYDVGNRDRRGFFFTVAGEVTWTVIAVNRGMYDLAAVCAVFAGMACLNWWKWGEVTGMALMTASWARSVASDDGFDAVVDRVASVVADAVGRRQFTATVTLTGEELPHWFRLRKLLVNLGYNAAVDGDVVSIDWRG